VVRRVWLLSGKKFDEQRPEVAIIAIGSVERHGDHLPLGTDTIVAQWIAEKVAEKVEADLYPPIWYGSCRGLRRFSGTIDVDEEALSKFLESVLSEIARQGYKLIVVVNGHGGNSHVVRVVARRVAYTYNIGVLVVDWWRDLAPQVREKLFAYPGHAGEDETSIMLYLHPESVDLDQVSDHTPSLPTLSLYSPKMDEKLYPHAVLGKASLASAEKGRIWLEAMVEHLADMIRKSLEILKS